MSEGPFTYAELAAMIRQCAGVTVAPETMSAQPELTFAELGVESLGVLGVVAAVENRYGVRLGADGEQCERPEQLRALVGQLITEEATDARAH